MLREDLDALRFSHPRTLVRFLDWPMADSKGNCEFRVIRQADGLERAIRTTARKRISPAARRVRIVTGDNGKTYVIGESDNGVQFVMSGAMRWVNWTENNEFIARALNDASIV